MQKNGTKPRQKKTDTSQNLADLIEAATNPALSPQELLLFLLKRFNNDTVRINRVYKKLKEKGEVQSQRQQYRNAVKTWSCVFKLALAFDNAKIQLYACNNVGIAHLSLGEYQKAREFQVKHLAIALRTGDLAAQVGAYSNLGLAYQSLGEYKKAIEFHEKYLAIAQQTGDLAAQRRAFNNLGIAYRLLGNAGAAIDMHQKQLRISRQTQDLVEEGRAYGNLGNAYHSSGKFQEAIELHQKCLAICQKTGDRAGACKAWTNLGNAYKSLGDFKKAIEMHEKCLARAERIDPEAEGLATCNLGLAYSSLGDCKKAIEFYEKHLSIAKRTGDILGEGKAYANLSVAFYSLGESAKATDMRQKFLSIVKQTDDILCTGAAFSIYGNDYQLQGDFERAIDMHKKQLDIARQTNDAAGQGMAYCNLGNACQGLGKFEEAIMYHGKCLEIAQETGNLDDQAAAYSNLGGDYLRKGDLDKAKEMCYHAIEALKRVRRSLGAHDEWKRPWLQQSDETYNMLIQTLVMMDQTDKALEEADGCKAQTLLDLLLPEATPQPAAPTTREMKDAAIQYGFTMVEYFLTKRYHFIEGSWRCDQVLYAWVVSADHGIQFAKVDDSSTLCGLQESLDQLVAPFYGNVDGMGQQSKNGAPAEVATEGNERIFARKNGLPSSLSTPLRRLHVALIEPIQRWLPTDPDKVVVIVPHKELSAVPFSGLRDEQGSSLIDKHAIVVTPSFKVFHGLRQSTPSAIKQTGWSKEPLIVGIRDFDGGAPQLPGAEQEARIIAQLLLHCNPTIAEDATKQHVLRHARSASLIHIASHCTSDTEKPAGSGLHGEILLRKESIDSVDLMKLDQMKSFLVVLSSCVSGLGKMTGDGVMGLPRAFFAKGCQMVIATLDRVDDDITVEFMRRFYGKLMGSCPADGPLDRGSVVKAFTETSREHKKNHPEPKHWASFVLYD